MNLSHFQNFFQIISILSFWAFRRVLGPALSVLRVPFATVRILCFVAACSPGAGVGITQTISGVVLLDSTCEKETAAWPLTRH